MAYIWGMSVSLGSAGEAEAFASSFRTDPVTIGGKEVRFSAAAGTDSDTGHECEVVPLCDGMDWLRCGGADSDDPVEVGECDALA